MLVRFVGLTSDSRNVRLLLQSLCTQIAKIYCKSTEISEVTYPFSFSSIVLLFVLSLNWPSEALLYYYSISFLRHSLFNNPLVLAMACDH